MNHRYICRSLIRMTLERLSYGWRLYEAWMRPADRALVLDCYAVYTYVITTTSTAAMSSLTDRTNYKSEVRITRKYKVIPRPRLHLSWI